MSGLLSTSQLYAQRCEQARRAFWMNNADLSDEIRQKLWLETESNIRDSLFNASPSSENSSCIPRSFSQQPSSSKMRSSSSQQSHQRKMKAPNTMNRKYSAPSSTSTRRAASFGSEQRPSMQVQEYDPATFVEMHGQAVAGSMDINRPPYGSSSSFQSSRPSLHLPTDQWTGSTSDFALPATPMSMTSATTFDGSMSRTTSSIGGQLGGHFDMLRIQSDMSAMSNLPAAEEHLFSGSYSSAVKPTDLSDYTRSHLVSHAGAEASFGEELLSPASMFPAPMSTAPSMMSQRSLSSLNPIVEEQKSTYHEQQSNYIPETPARHIAPKSHLSSSHAAGTQTLARDCMSLPVNMGREHAPAFYEVPSTSGEPAGKKALPRTHYRRPVKEKRFCTKCDDHPEGFRGDHELTRHIQRKHSTVRKCWIAVDVSPDKSFLANCRHCCGQKKYYAYYNLAAHLRRVHFSKKGKPGRGRRKRGAPIPEHEKKGGKSGGDKPSIEELKEQGWIKEIEETVDSDELQPSDTSDDDEDAYMMNDDMQSFDLSFTSSNGPYSSTADTNPYFDQNLWQQQHTADVGMSNQYDMDTELSMMHGGADDFVNTYTTQQPSYALPVSSDFSAHMQVSSAGVPPNLQFMQH